MVGWDFNIHYPNDKRYGNGLIGVNMTKDCAIDTWINTKLAVGIKS